jgi:hypothetical protein
VFDFTANTRGRAQNIDGVDFLEYYDSETPENKVRFYVDADGYVHVVVYIERDGHEFWPTEEGDVRGANEHNGKGLSYLVAYDNRRPLNLGEVDYPLSENAKIIMRFNGFWGCWHWAVGNNPPRSPSLHKYWTWPMGSAIRNSWTGGDFE